MSFRSHIEIASKKNDSRVVLALDYSFMNSTARQELLEKASHVIDNIHSQVCAIKFNHHLVLPLGTFGGIQKLVKKAHDHSLPAIMDCKINDIGATNQVIAEYYYAAGFDAVIANPFVGWEEGLKPVFDVAHRLEKAVILLVYMSHKGASEGYGQTIIDPDTGERVPQYMSFAKKALKYRADGVIVGATCPQKIREVNTILSGKVPIFSPGIGAQGGDVDAAFDSGASYVIAGRSIVQTKDPAKAVKELKKHVKRANKQN
jgi:orotidine-5'-phosphate decarboxylase